MKKIIYYLVSLLIVIIVSIIIFEIILNIVPLIYRNLKNNSNKTYVYLLGESSAFGAPYSGKISFSQIIKYNLANRINNKKIESIIIAAPGNRMIHQYFKYFTYKYTHPFKKGIVFMYMGTNNWAVKEEKHFSKERFFKFNIFNLLNQCFGNQYDFEYEFEKIISLAKSFGDDLYISTIAGNYAGFMPENIATLSDNFYYIDDLIFNKKYDFALSKCNDMLKKYKDKSQIWYRIGKIYEKQNRIKEAKESYLNAIEYGYDARPTRYQNSIIKKLAYKYNIPITDTFSKLNNSDEITGYNFFIDKIHPNIRLHKIIAEGFIELLSKKYNLSVNKNFSEKEILKISKFNDNDLFVLHRDGLGEIIIYSYRGDNILDRFNLEIIKQHMALLKNIAHDNEQKITLLFFDALLAYIQGNKIETLRIIKSNDLTKYFDTIKIHGWKLFFKEWFINLVEKEKT